MVEGTALDGRSDNYNVIAHTTYVIKRTKWLFAEVAECQ
jgi:hypothetical protein